AFLHVLEIVQPEADALRWPRHRQAELKSLERHARARRRLLGEVRERLEIASRLRQHVGQIDRQPGVGGLQVDHIIALDHAQAQPLVALKSYNFHVLTLQLGTGRRNGRGPRAGSYWM